MKQDVAAYIKYYNLERLHSSNGNQSPIEFENSFRKDNWTPSHQGYGVISLLPHKKYY